MSSLSQFCRVLALLMLLYAFNPAQAITITASNNWESCQLQDNVTNAGDYYSSSIESATLTCSDSYISISGTANSSTAWTVSSSLNSVPSGISLALVRIDAGDGGGVVTGGTNYTTQTTASGVFFSGTGDVSQIKIRFRIGNFDVNDGNGIKNIQLNYDVSTTN